MAKLVEIGALVEKHVAADSFKKIYELDGVEYVFLLLKTSQKMWFLSSWQLS